MVNLKIETLVVGQMQSNCYFISDPESFECLIIDPGDDGDYIVRKIQENNLKPKMILATHGHFDHIMSATEVKLAFNLKFKIHKDDEFLVKNMTDSAGHFLGITTDPPPDIDSHLKDGDKITVGKFKLKVLETPGHTPGSICFYCLEENLLITGDTLFADGGVGRTDFSYSNHDELVKSLTKIFSLPGKTQIYPGHGPTSTLSKESRNHL